MALAEVLSSGLLLLMQGDTESRPSGKDSQERDMRVCQSEAWMVPGP